MDLYNRLISASRCRCSIFANNVSYPVTADLVGGAETCCGCSVPLRWCERSSKDPTVCVLTGRNLGPSPQYFARGNRFHSSATYRRKSGTTVSETGGKDTRNKLNGWIKAPSVTDTTCAAAVNNHRALPFLAYMRLQVIKSLLYVFPELTDAKLTTRA